MQHNALLAAIDSLLPQIHASRDTAGTLLKYAQDNSLEPAQLERLGQLFNVAKTNAYLAKFAHARGDSFSTVNVPELVGDYTTWRKAAVTTSLDRFSTHTATGEFTFQKAAKLSTVLMDGLYVSHDMPRDEDPTAFAERVLAGDRSVAYAESSYLSTLEKIACEIYTVREAMEREYRRLCERVFLDPEVMAKAAGEAILMRPDTIPQLIRDIEAEGIVQPYETETWKHEPTWRKIAHDSTGRAVDFLKYDDQCEKLFSLCLKYASTAGVNFDNAEKDTEPEPPKDPEPQPPKSAPATREEREQRKHEREQRKHERDEEKYQRETKQREDDAAASEAEKQKQLSDAINRALMYDVNYRGPKPPADPSLQRAYPTVTQRSESGLGNLIPSSPSQAPAWLRDVIQPAVLPSQLLSARNETAAGANLQRLLMTDPVLSKMDRNQVVQHYNTIHRNNPRLAQDINVLRGMLREMTQYSGAPLQSVQVMTDLRKNQGQVERDEAAQKTQTDRREAPKAPAKDEKQKA